MSDVKEVKNIKVKAIRGFLYQGKMINIGDTLTVPEPRAKLFVTNGYASTEIKKVVKKAEDAK